MWRITLMYLFFTLRCVAGEAELPSSTKATMDAFNKTADKLTQDYNKALSDNRSKAILALIKLQETETKKGNLDGAVAIRNKIEQWVDLNNEGVDLLGASKPDKTALNLVPTMTATDGMERNSDGSVTLHRGKLITPTSFKTPMEVTIIALTTSKDIRISMAGLSQIIFNWGGSGSPLRVDGFGLDGGIVNLKSKEGAGTIPINEWVTFVFTVMKDELAITVNGKEVYREKGEFSVDAPVTISPSGSAIKVKAVSVKSSK